MTQKIIDVGALVSDSLNQKAKTKKLVPIKPLFWIDSSGKMQRVKSIEEVGLNSTRYIELIARGYTINHSKPMDLFFIYDDPNERRCGIMYLGYWNDGVVK